MMTRDRKMPGAVPIIVATILVTAALYLARSVLEPVAFAVFIVALAAPLQTLLRRHMPAALALVLTIFVTLAVVAALILIIIWSLGDIAYWVVGNIGRFQASYAEANRWLEGHDVHALSLMSQRFDPAWVAGPLRSAASSAQTVVGFIMLAFVFIVLGLKESTQLPALLRRVQGPEMQWDPVATGLVVAAKYRRYMGVRAVASVLTGAATAALAMLLGVELPLAWGVLAFAFNFLPFIGPLIVVVLMTLFTAAQFGTWQPPLMVLVTVSIAQFGIGSYLEPILAGAALSMSPFIVLLAVFFWGLLWGIPGAFLGVPIVILVLTICEQMPGSRWVSTLLSGNKDGQPN
nr:AI-2E family transporter [Polymorphobacter sp.]